MITYRKLTTARGYRYMKDAKFAKLQDFPEFIQSRLEKSDEVTDTDRSCVFCNEPTKTSRLVNVQPVYLCAKHYYSETIGKIAAKVNQTAK